MPQSDATLSATPALSLSKIFAICTLALAGVVAMDLAIFARWKGPAA